MTKAIFPNKQETGGNHESPKRRKLETIMNQARSLRWSKGLAFVISYFRTFVIPFLGREANSYCKSSALPYLDFAKPLHCSIILSALNSFSTRCRPAAPIARATSR